MLQESPENVDFILKAPTSSYKSVLVAERKTRHKEQQSAIRTCAQIHGKIFPHWSLYKFQKLYFMNFLILALLTGHVIAQLLVFA